MRLHFDRFYHQREGPPRVFQTRNRLGRASVQNCPCENVYLFEGSDILQDIGGLSPDLLHPGDQGMIFMGENLARKIKPLIAPFYP